LTELWYWVVFLIVGGMATAVLDALFFFLLSLNTPFSSIFGLVTLLPNISVVVRRLHDVDRSGWWYLLMFIPMVGLIILIVFCMKQATAGDNRFGPEPVRARS